MFVRIGGRIHCFIISLKEGERTIKALRGMFFDRLTRIDCSG